MHNRKLTNKGVTHFLFTVPALVIYSIFFMSPVVLGIYYSFTNWNGISKTHKFVGFENYFAVLKSQRFFDSISFNFKYSVLLIIIVIALSLTIALIFNTDIKGIGIYKSIYFFPAVLSLITVGLVFNEIYYRVFPLVGEALNIEFLKGNILAKKETAMYGILLVDVWKAVTIPTILFLTGIKSIPINLYEAASIDGANGWQRFKAITLPYLTPTFSMVFILQLKAGLVIFDYIVALTSGGPGRVTESIGLLIYQHGMVEFKYSYAVTESVLLFIILAVISFAQIMLTRKRNAV